MTETPVHPLWLTPETLTALRQRITREGVVQRLYQHALSALERFVAEESASPGEDEPKTVREEQTNLLYERMEVAAFLALVDDHREAAEWAWRWTARALKWETQSDLGRADQAVHVGQAYSWCRTYWTPEACAETEDWLLAMATRLQPVNSDCKGNPDNPFNNWYAVTQGGAAVAALAILDHRPEAELLYRRSRERVQSYLTNYGEEGVSYEGIGYGCYAMHGWGPLVLALKVRGEDLTRFTPGLRRASRFIASVAVARRSPAEVIDEEDSARTPGSRLTWNDDGTGLPGGRILGLLYAFGEPAWQPTIEAHFASCRHPGELPIGARGSGFSWLALFWPPELGTAAPDPAALPLSLYDKRLGWTVFRNRYQDAEDCVLGVYAKAYHPGGHSHEDVGSWRFYGLDGGWSQGGGQNKTAPIYQSAILKNGQQYISEQRVRATEGQISYHAAYPDGSGVVNVRMAKVYNCLIADRNFAIDYSGRAGVPVVLGLYDELWDREEADWSWTLCLESDLLFEPWPEENGFILRQPRNGASAAFRFLGPEKLTFTLVEGPPTQRTFSGGTVRNYRGSRYIEARVRAVKTAFFAVATFQKGEIPELLRQGTDKEPEARLGGVRIYRQQGKWYHGPVRIESLAEKG